MIRIRDVADVQSLEDKLLFSNGHDTPEISEVALRISQAVFDVDRKDVERFREQDLLDAFYFPPSEVVAMMLTFGVDFRSEDGFPLRCVEVLAPFAEVAARKLAGRLPSQEDLQSARWETDLAKAAAEFSNKKRDR